MESYFHSLKAELVHQHRWATSVVAQRKLFAYAEGYDNRARIHSASSYFAPEQAERKASQPRVHRAGRINKPGRD